MPITNRNIAKLALQFVLIMGIVNFFADMTYEGARSIVGPFLGSLGAGAATVGFVAGLGELTGYALRSITGYFADKTRQYWAMAFLGYAINMLAVPALALAGNWPLAAALMVSERTGRAVRKPAVDSMLSYAGKTIGHGWVFGLNEALDQTGETLGPLITAWVLYRRKDYHPAFAVLLISALLCLAVLVVAWLSNRRPQQLEESEQSPQKSATAWKSLPRTSETQFSKAYWLYVTAGALIAAGFADFSLIAFHFRKTGAVPEDLIPVFYAVAMVSGALAAPIFGKLLDKMGLRILVVVFAAPAFFAPLVFLGGTMTELLGMILWGVGMGAQDSCLKAVLSKIAPSAKRGVTFGVFDTAFGLFWFAGSAIMGLLYEHSLPALIAFSILTQLCALPVFVLARKEMVHE